VSSVVAIDSKNALSFSSFGPENTTFGNGFRASLLNGDRYRELDRKQSYYDCTQYDTRLFDFDGRVSSPRSTQPMLGAEKASWYVPLNARRPSAPYRFGKIIVDSFTNLLFGDQRFPAIRVDGDKDTEDFHQTVARVGRLPLKMIEARRLGGSMGAVGLSWSWYKGKPRYEVHNAKNVFVHSWDDRVEMIPRHVSEVYTFYKIQWNGKEFAKVDYWFRRDWTPDWDIVFKDVLAERGKEPFWVPDLAKSANHNDGLNHFVWVQNRPSDQVDGLADYEGLYDSFESIDLLMSVVSRGAILNLDPTLKLKMDPELVSRMGVRKGSDNAIVVGKDGDAEYMELGGTSIEAGTKLIEMMRRAILETAQCVVPDPHEVAAQGVSSVAIKAMFSPMLAQADVLREQYGAGIERLLDGPATVAREASRSRVVVVDGETGEESDGEAFFDLPPKVETKQVTDPLTGEQAVDPMTGEPVPDEVVRTPRGPGVGGEINLRWPLYFTPTPDDQGKIVTNMQMATGGKAFLSKKTATEIASTAFGIDPAEEQRRLDEQGGKEKAAQAEMFPGAGMEGDDAKVPPAPGAEPNQPPLEEDPNEGLPPAEE
jgi:hypothetical protein